MRLKCLHKRLSMPHDPPHPPQDPGRLPFGETHLRSILATVPDAMVVIDKRGQILSFSAAAEKMFGFDEAEVLGENVSMMMPSPDRERHDSYLSNYEDTGHRKIIGIGRVTTARHRDGYTFPIELSVGEAEVEGRRIFTGFIRDLTERQHTELRLQDLQSELAHVGRVSEVGTLASALAHELNQPLTAIANYCEAARDMLAGSPDAETIGMIQEALDDAARQSVRAGQIVRRLRDFITYGQTERKVENLVRLIAEANALGLIGSREHGIEVDITIDSDAGDVLVDRIQIQQVLLNLIRNAIDAMDAVRVKMLTISAVPDGEGFVEISVADSGKGIDPAMAENLFQPFLTTKEHGMGVGLSICRTIIEAHGGRIWFEPRKGGGTVFRFTIPDASSADA